MEINDIRSRMINLPVAGSVKSHEKTEALKEPGDRVSIGSQSENTIGIDILHLNDIHGQVTSVRDVETNRSMGGLAQVKTVIDAERESNPEGTMVLHAGDIAEGTMESYISKGKVITEAFNQIGFDATALGNHDFVWGQDNLKCLVYDLSAPVVAANVTKADGSGTFDGTKPYIMKDLNGVKVAVIGLDTADTLRYLDKSKTDGINFENYADTVKKYMPEVREQGADLVVVLSHLGFNEDKKLAEDVPGIDVIVGGHSHTELTEGHRQGDTIIVQAGSQGRYVGKLHLEIDRDTKKIASSRAKMIPVVSDEIQPDPRIQKVLEPYLKEVEKLGSRIMGHATEDLPFAHKEAAILNQAYADAILEKSGAQIGIASARKLRAGIQKGDVTYSALYSAVPFVDEKVVTIKARGHSILAELENRVKDGGRGVIVPSGFKYSYDPSLPNGQRVTSAVLNDGSPLDPEKEYHLVLDDTTVRNQVFGGYNIESDEGSCQEIFMNYFQKIGTWSNTPDNRVVRA